MFLRTLTTLILALCMVTAQAQTAEKEQKVKITTMFGEMIVKLYNDTPLHRDNFIKNAKNGWYDGTLFHRVMPYFMAQGGDPNSVEASGEQVLGRDNCQTLPAEIRRHHIHKKGALAAARTPDGVNPERRSSGCQFFIVQGHVHNDDQLTGMENENFKFSDVAKAYYKTTGGSAFLDMSYTVFGEVIEGLEIIDLICAMPTGGKVTDRPNTDIMMKVELID